MKNQPIPRLDRNPQLHDYLLKYCRIQKDEIWCDPLGKHRIGCLDAANHTDIHKLMGDQQATLALHDPPYNLVAFEQQKLEEFIAWCREWIRNTDFTLAEDSSLYIWLGVDQTAGFQPLPDFMIMMRDMPFKTRSFITMRNQRGYGTQKNWMAIRQELLFYIKGNPIFNIEGEYTDIPKILRGYYKEVDGKVTENMERSKSENIRAGNVWVDIQQVFYRMEENINGCYAQKPLKSSERIINASSRENDIVVDFFCHSGSTLLASEILKRKCYTIDFDPIYCEIGIRRLEHFRSTGKTGWQNGNPFEKEIILDTELQNLLGVTTKEVEGFQYALTLE